MENIHETLADANRLFQTGEYKRAEEICLRILRENPDEPGALSIVGGLAFQAGRHAESVRILQRAARLAPDRISSYLNLLRVYIAIGDGKSAIMAADYAMGKFPGNSELEAMREDAEKTPPRAVPRHSSQHAS